MLRKLLLLGGVVAAAVVVAMPAGAAKPRLSMPVSSRPVPSLTPAKTAGLWRKLVRRPRSYGANALDDCRPLRAVFYAGTDWLRLATKLAASPSACAEYYISIPPLSADKTAFRTDQAWRIRALGPQFHVLAEAHVGGWSGWVSATGNGWYAAGVEARRRMAAAGYDVTAGDSWVVNELSSAVRRGDGNARANMRAFVRGLYDGDGAGPATRGGVFITGMSQATPDLAVYQARLQDWYEDAAFWADMSAYVTDWSQELYGDVRTYAVVGSDLSTRRDYLNEYLQHELALAHVAPASAAAAQEFLDAAYNPLANAAWQYDAAFGWTNVPYDLMEQYISTQTYALRHAGASAADRFGFAWAPKNLAALPTADFIAQTDAILDRLAAAISDSAQTVDPADAGIGACGPFGQNTWCGGDLADASFNDAWKSLATWRPSAIAFTTAPQTFVAWTSSAPLTIEYRASNGAALTVGAPLDVTLASDSAGAGFSTSANGPWASTLAITIPSGASSTSFYYRDTQAGTPTITAAAAGKTSGTQTETVTPDTVAPETTLTSAPSGVIVSTSASLTFTASEPGSQFECSFDAAAFTACTSPASYAGLVDGQHTFDVRAVDLAGNADPSPARATWTVDTVAPDTRITSAPASTTTSRSATFAFAATETDVRFECALDYVAFTACSSPWTSAWLAKGWHTFRVRAVDAAANVDATPASYTWRVK